MDIVPAARQATYAGGIDSLKSISEKNGNFYFLYPIDSSLWKSCVRHVPKKTDARNVPVHLYYISPFYGRHAKYGRCHANESSTYA